MRLGIPGLALLGIVFRFAMRKRFAIPMLILYVDMMLAPFLYFLNVLAVQRRIGVFVKPAKHPHVHWLREQTGVIRILGPSFFSRISHSVSCCFVIVCCLANVIHIAQMLVYYGVLLASNFLEHYVQWCLSM